MEALDATRWSDAIHEQAHKDMCTQSTELALLEQEASGLGLPHVYVAVYGNELRRKMVKEKLGAYLATIEVDTHSSIKAERTLDKLNRNQRRLLFDLFRVKRAKKDKKAKKHKKLKKDALVNWDS